MVIFVTGPVPSATPVSRPGRQMYQSRTEHNRNDPTTGFFFLGLDEAKNKNQIKYRLSTRVHCEIDDDQTNKKERERKRERGGGLITTCPVSS